MADGRSRLGAAAFVAALSCACGGARATGTGGTTTAINTQAGGGTTSQVSSVDAGSGTQAASATDAGGVPEFAQPACTNPTPAQTATIQRAFAEGSGAFARADFGAAAQAFRRAYDACPSPELAFNVARAHGRNGDIDVALDYFGRALTPATPAQQREYIEGQVASLRAYQERLRSGIAQAPASNDALEQEGLTWFRRGLALFGRRQYPAAQLAFEQAHQYLRDHSPELFFNLAVVNERLNHFAQALEFYREYLSARRGTPEEPDILRRIRAVEQRQSQGP